MINIKDTCLELCLLNNVWCVHQLVHLFLDRNSFLPYLQFVWKSERRSEHFACVSEFGFHSPYWSADFHLHQTRKRNQNH